MAIPSVPIMPMKRTVRVGGAIPIMEHFFVEMEIVSTNPGVVMDRMIAEIIPMKFIVHHDHHVES